MDLKITIMTTIDMKKMPGTWAVCFNEACPMRETCLRFMAGQQLLEGVTAWPTVVPTALSDGRCRAFCEAKTERMAYGFRHLYDHVEQQVYRSLKTSVKQYLGGHSSYYRYHRGEKLLSPEQQQHIVELFRQYGYKGEVVFEAFCDELQFPFMQQKVGAPY